MNINKLSFLFLFVPAAALSQSTSSPIEVLSLDDCIALSCDNYPAVKQYGLIERSRDYTVSNAGTAWLPRIDVSAGIYGFTDIIDGSIGAAIDIDNHLANASVTVSQNIYDGGRTAANKRVARAEAAVQSRALDVTMYDVRTRVENIFFGILLIDEQLRQNDMLQEDLRIGLKAVRDMEKGGIASADDIEEIEVELLRAEQQAVAYEASRSAYVRMLSVFIGKSLSDDIVLARPTPISLSEASGNGTLRPEWSYYIAQEKLVDEQLRQLNVGLLPTLSAFGTGTLHSRPTSFTKSGVLLGGISLSWNIGALYTRKNDKGRLAVQKESIGSEKAVFLFNNRIQNADINGAIATLMRQIERDDKIVALRENIRSRSEKKVQLGTESVSDMLRNINDVSLARQQRAIHEIQLLQEYYNLKNINNTTGYEE